MAEEDRMRVLISLRRGYGLGDGVQMSSVLRHIAKHKPHWLVDYQAEAGRHCVGRGIVDCTFAHGDKYPHDYYDAWVELLLYDNWSNWSDRPNTRVSSCLHSIFNMGWDPECGRYQVRVSAESAEAARTLLAGDTSGRRCVALHYMGDSSQDRKNLSHEQAAAICAAVEDCGFAPIILDWRKKCPLEKYRRITTPAHWGADAEMICAVISQCAGFIGIDSGPAKCASSTETPSLVIWSGHNPIPFHDPAPNTVHLIREGYWDLYPAVTNGSVIEWFERHNEVRWFDDEFIGGVRNWLYSAKLT